MWVLKARAIVAAAAVLGAFACSPPEKEAAAAGKPYVLAASELAAGRHLSIVGGCNDCHTEGYAQSGGNVPESEWLKGSHHGNYGPWGTSYAANLRLVAAGMSAEEWVTMLHTREDGLPPMPWSIVREYDARDLRALHTFILSLGEPGEPTPTALPPGTIPQTPYDDYLTHAGPPPAR